MTEQHHDPRHLKAVRTDAPTETPEMTDEELEQLVQARIRETPDGDTLELFGRTDPRGSDGYKPGAWDQIRAAHLDGHISEEAYDLLRETIMITMVAEPLRDTLAYAWQRLQSTGDPADRYCAQKIRAHLAMHETEDPSDS